MGRMLDARKDALTAVKLEPKNPKHRGLLQKIDDAMADAAP
jgi:hypothetical protein